MRDMVGQQGFASDALKGFASLLAPLTEAEKNNIMEKAHNSIILSLGDNALTEISREKIAQDGWLKLQQL